MLGKSTFGLSMWLLKWFPMRLVDRFLLIVSWLMLGDTSRFGLDRPRLGPLELKNLSGKTPVLDVGTLGKIKGGDIKVLATLLFSSNQIYNFAFFFFFLLCAPNLLFWGVTKILIRPCFLLKPMVVPVFFFSSFALHEVQHTFALFLC